MSNASLKDQLQAMAVKLSETVVTDKIVPEKKVSSPEAKTKPAHPKPKHKTVSTDKLKKPKPRWLDYAQYGVELLKVYFPSCFKPMNEVKPLKKGIKQDLILRLSTLETIATDDKACMVKSLSYYVNTTAYHKSMIAGTARVDLDGQLCEVVSLEEAQYSAERQTAKLQAKQMGTVPAQGNTELTKN